VTEGVDAHAADQHTGNEVDLGRKAHDDGISGRRPRW
jgi:hypothetical protein